MKPHRTKRLPFATLKSIAWHVNEADTLLKGLVILGKTEEQLAIAVKALRGIVSSATSDDRSRGLAEGALRRIGL